jgi:mono/diheme cytochrome c family protein
MSLVVVSVIVGLAFLWHYTSLLGPSLAAKANPGTTSFVPRPDWYFYFLFYLLRIFKWPNSVVIGTVGIPTLLLILLLAIPFLDVRRERRLLRRPVAIVTAVLVAVSMGVLTYKGATAKEALGAELKAAVPGWIAKEKLPPEAKPGAELFATSGCLNCHTYNGVGGSQLGAPNLTAEGAKNKGIAFQIAHLKCPSCVNKGSPMPSFAAFGEENLRKIAIFLEASKGAK